jgi:uncharacterized Ntn-hydrolase superfamily protein
MKKITVFVFRVVLLTLICFPLLVSPARATFSIVAHDPVLDEWGVAVQSKVLAVGATVPFARAGIGAIATQAWSNKTYGTEGLKLLMLNLPAGKTVEILMEKDEQKDYRQLGIVDARGKSAAMTGSKCKDWAGHITGDGFTVQGNILTGEAVVKEMAAAYEATGGSLAERLLAALKAGQAAGGDSRGKQSAALLVVREAGGYSGYDDRMIDLRVDDHSEPIVELERLYYLQETISLGSTYARAATLYHDAGQPEKAESALNRAFQIIRKYPAEALLLNQIAWDLATRDFKLDKALELAKDAVKLAPADANIWDTLGEVYARLERYAEAVEAEKKAVDLAEDDAGLFKEKLNRWKNTIDASKH